MNENYYKTSDLSLATTLSLYFPIESTELLDGKKVLFVFINSTQIDEITTKYWNGELRIEPQQFFNQLKIIKTRIYSRI